MASSSEISALRFGHKIARGSVSNRTGKLAHSSEPETDPEILAQRFASRVDRLIEQAGGTTAKIGVATYHFTNGGPTVNVEKSDFFETDSYTYPYTEGITAEHPPEGGPVTFREELSVKNPAFGQSASGEFSLNQASLIRRMDEMICTVERYVLQGVHLGNIQPLSFPTPIKSAA